DELLARPALAGDERGRGIRCQPLEEGEQLEHGGGAAHHPFEGRRGGEIGTGAGALTRGPSQGEAAAPRGAAGGRGGGLGDVVREHQASLPPWGRSVGPTGRSVGPSVPMSVSLLTQALCPMTRAAQSGRGRHKSRIFDARTPRTPAVQRQWIDGAASK